jgi:uncharacterized protein YjbI with pentapeptide repeats
MKRIKHFLKEEKPDWLTRKSVLTTLGALGLIGGLLHLGYAVEWTGLKQDSSITKIDRKTKEGKELEVVTTTTIQDPKKLWDWLSLLGVPAGLAAFGYYSQVSQQRRADQEEALEKKLAETRQQEEAFQNYVDRMSELLIGRNLIAVAKNLDAEKSLYKDFLRQFSIKRAMDFDMSVFGTKERWVSYEDEKERLESIVQVIQSRTLSIFRQIENNPPLKTNVFKFLIDTEILTVLKPNLTNRQDFKSANFRGMDLSGVDLSGSDLNFNDSDFRGANLSKAILSRKEIPEEHRAKFQNANFTGADLSGAELSGGDFSNAIFQRADLTFSILAEANFTGADFYQANFWAADVREAIFEGADLEEAQMGELNDKHIRDEQLTTARLLNTGLPSSSELNPNRDEAKTKVRKIHESPRKRK